MACFLCFFILVDVVLVLDGRCFLPCFLHGVYYAALCFFAWTLNFFVIVIFVIVTEFSGFWPRVESLQNNLNGIIIKGIIKLKP